MKKFGIVLMFMLVGCSSSESSMVLDKEVLPTIDNFVNPQVFEFLLDEADEVSSFTLSFNGDDFSSLWVSVLESDINEFDVIFPITVIQVSKDGDTSLTDSDTLNSSRISSTDLYAFFEEFQYIDWVSTFDVDTASTQTFTFLGNVTGDMFLNEDNVYVLENGVVYPFDEYDEDSEFYCFQNSTPAATGAFQILYQCK